MKTSTNAILILLVLVVAWEAPAATTISPEQSLGLLKYTHIELVDDTKGDCWTNLNTVREDTTLALEQSDIGVSSEELFTFPVDVFSIKITVLGNRIPNGVCIGAVTFKVQTRGYLELGDTDISVDLTTSVMTQLSVAINPDNLNDSISRMVKNSVTNLTTTVLANRRDPTVAEIDSVVEKVDPITQKDFENYLRQTNEPQTSQ